MRVLITGGAGFIGSRLVGRLLKAGDHVTVVDDLSLGNRANLEGSLAESNFRLIVEDCNAPAFASVVAEAQPDLVYHLAANSDISRGTSDPRTDLERTFLTTFSVLDAMRRASVRDVVFASTSAIYGEAPGNVREDHGPLRPISLYGAAKLASEGYISAYAALFNLRAFVFRFPNVVGPQLTHGAIYDFVQRLFRDRTHLRVLGNGTQTKPYIDVDDLLDAIALGIKSGGGPLETYNVAGEGATSVRAMAELVREVLGLPDATIEYGKEDRGWPGDVPRFAYDTSRIRSLGWQPRRTSDEAVRAAIETAFEQCKRSF